MKRLYTLDKVSSPGFTLETNTLHHVVSVLSMFICTACTSSDAQDDECSDIWPDNFTELTDKEQVDFLLSTACGCEFFLSESDEDEE